MKNKIKCISFLPGFIDKIKSGQKTVTRRIKTNLKEGDIVYFKAGKNGKKEGCLKIIKISKEKLQDIWADRDDWGMRSELSNEGMFVLRELLYQFQDFKKLWDRINKKGNKWRDNPEIYRIEFKYLEVRKQ